MIWRYRKKYGLVENVSFWLKDLYYFPFMQSRKVCLRSQRGSRKWLPRRVQPSWRNCSRDVDPKTSSVWSGSELLLVYFTCLQCTQFCCSSVHSMMPFIVWLRSEILHVSRRMRVSWISRSRISTKERIRGSRLSGHLQRDVRNARRGTAPYVLL